MPLRTAPLLAWRLLVHERGRLLASVGGITFAALLMTLQLSFRNALLDSSLELLTRLDADIIVTHKEKKPFLRRKAMPRERVYQSLSVDGVESAYPVWLALLPWKNLEDGTQRPIRVTAFIPGDPVFLIDEVQRAAAKLRQRATGLIDLRSRSDYGSLALGPAQVGQHQIEVVGSFELGTDVEADGNLIVSDLTFQKIANKKLDMVEMAVLKLDRNANPDTVLVALRAALPTDVVPMTKEQLIARDLDYWGSRTPLSIMLLVGMALGFSVGVVICYQILYTDVIDHLKEFATAKAMGYADSYIRGVVITEALVLGLLGIGPSLLLGAGLQRLLGLLTGLPVRFSWGSALLVLLLSLGMCTLSGLIAMRKVQELDPAELF